MPDYTPGTDYVEGELTPGQKEQLAEEEEFIAKSLHAPLETIKEMIEDSADPLRVAAETLHLCTCDIDITE